MSFFSLALVYPYRGLIFGIQYVSNYFALKTPLVSTGGFLFHEKNVSFLFVIRKICLLLSYQNECKMKQITNTLASNTQFQEQATAINWPLLAIGGLLAVALCSFFIVRAYRAWKREAGI